MNLTDTTNQTTVTSVAMRSGTLVILSALVHVVSNAVTNMLSALLPTLQKKFSLSETVLALLVSALSFSALVTSHYLACLQIGWDIDASPSTPSCSA